MPHSPDLTVLYLSILPDMNGVCLGMGKNPQQREDNLGLIGLAFMEAVATCDGRSAVTDWVCLKLRNAVQNHNRREQVRQTYQLDDLPEDVKAFKARESFRDLWLDVSEDARRVARAIMVSDASPTKAVMAVSGEMYCKMTWRRFWQAISELREYLEGV